MKTYSLHISSWALSFVLLWSPYSTANQQQETLDDGVRAHLKSAIAKSSSFKDRFDAEVWMVDMSRRLERYVKNPEERFRLLRMIHANATAFDLDPGLVLAVIQTESAFDSYAVSIVGARGIMQVMPFWKKEIGTPEDNLINAATNLRYGCAILRHYIDREKGNIPGALARYNGSYGTTKYSDKVLKAWNRRWR